MPVQKIKSDLNSLCSMSSLTIIECERMKTIVDSLGMIQENDLTRMVQSANNTIGSITRFEREVKTVHSECMNELDIFFKEYNSFTQRFITECTTIISQLQSLIKMCESCYEFYQISDEMEWIVMCGITPQLFNWIVSPLYTFKNQLQTLQLKTYTNNNKLIVKVR